MATKNIVPRANGEGGLGTSALRWLTGYINTLTGNLVGNVEGNATGLSNTDPISMNVSAFGPANDGSDRWITTRGITTTDMFIGPLSGNADSATTLANPVIQPFPNVFNVRAYGAVGNGSTDDTAAIQAAINAATTANGGTVYFPRAKYLVSGALTITNDGASSMPHQPSLRFVGDGADSNADSITPTTGTVLDMRYNSTGPAKLDTRGFGSLEISGIAFTDAGGDSKPFLQTTNTTLFIHHCSFWGSKAQAACDQDAIVLGSTGTTTGGNIATSPFAGYGTVIAENMFSGIRRCVFGQVYANGNVIRDNIIGIKCGAPSGSYAAIEFVGGGGQSDAGNVITGNLLELYGYVYGIRLTTGVINTISGNNSYDESSSTLAVVRLESGCNQNIITAGFSGKPYLSDASTFYNSFISNVAGEANGIVVGGGLKLVPVNRSGSTHDYAFIAGYPSQYDGSLQVYDKTSNAIRVLIDSSGHVGLGGNVAPSNALSVTGNVDCSYLYASGILTSGSQGLADSGTGNSRVYPSATGVLIDNQTAGNVPLTINNQATPSTDLLRVQAAGTTKVAIDSTGSINGIAETLTGNLTLNGGHLVLNNSKYIYGGGPTISATNVMLGSGAGGTELYSRGNKTVVYSSGGNTTYMTLTGGDTADTGRVGINATPATTAALDVTSTTKGFLAPRMTTTQKAAISSPAEGLTVYDLTLHKLCVFTGSVWETVTSS